MRWTMPIFALALAIALGAIGPQPVRQPAGPGRAPGHAVTAPLALPSLAGFSLFASAEATTLDAARPACPSPRTAAAAPRTSDNALLWAASLRGWSDGPTVWAWRRFVAWTKQGLSATPNCATTQASLG